MFLVCSVVLLACFKRVFLKHLMHHKHSCDSRSFCCVVAIWFQEIVSSFLFGRNFLTHPASLPTQNFVKRVHTHSHQRRGSHPFVYSLGYWVCSFSLPLSRRNDGGGSDESPLFEKDAAESDPHVWFVIFSRSFQLHVFESRSKFYLRNHVWRRRDERDVSTLYVYTFRGVFIHTYMLRRCCMSLVVWCLSCQLVWSTRC